MGKILFRGGGGVWNSHFAWVPPYSVAIIAVEISVLPPFHLGRATLIILIKIKEVIVIVNL